MVFRARQMSLRRLVALKMILDGPLASRGFVERFHTEAEAAAKLHHPNIVPIYEIGEHEGRRFFSLKLLEGGSLAQRLVTGGVKGVAEARAVAAMLREICLAVHHAHQHGVLHRDIKPGNILFDAEGTPYVADFGLARLVEKESGLTQTGTFLGTPAYMAPEQAAEDKQLTTATDIYGLGAILFHVLTGRPPFQGPTVVETLRLVAEQEPPSPRLLNPVVDRDLATICLKCLAKAPQTRYTSARALAEDLARWLAGQTVLARPATTAERFLRWCRRRPALAGLSAAVGALLVATVAVSIGAFIRVDKARSAAEAAEKKATDKLWESYLAQARAQRWSGRAGRRLESLRAIASAALIRPSAELRNEAIACMTLDDVRPIPGPSTTDLRQRLFIDWTRDRYALADVNGAISMRRLKDNAEVFGLPALGTNGAGWISGSPDGCWLRVMYKDGSARLWDLRSRTVAADVSGGDSQFTGDSRRLALAEAGSRISLLELDGSGRKQVMASPVPATKLWCGPTGDLIAGGDGAVVFVLNVKAGTTVRFQLPSYVYDVAWQPHGDFLAAACDDQHIYPLNVRTGEVLPALIGHHGAVTGVAFHPGGTLLASDSWDGRLRLWDFVAGKQILSVPAGAEGIAFSLDGQHLAVYSYAQARVELFEVALNDAQMDLAWPNQQFTQGQGDALLFGPKGDWLLTRTDDALSLWDARAGRPLGRVENQQFGQLRLIEQGRRVFGWNQETFQRLSFLDGNEGKNLAVERFAPGIPSSLEKLCPPGFFDHMGSDPSVGRSGASLDGRVTAVVLRENCYLFDMEAGTLLAVTGRQSAMKYVALSPDGQWVASGGWHAPGVKIWNVATGRLIKELPTDVSPKCFLARMAGGW